MGGVGGRYGETGAMADMVMDPQAMIGGRLTSVWIIQSRRRFQCMHDFQDTDANGGGCRREVRFREIRNTPQTSVKVYQSV